MVTRKEPPYERLMAYLDDEMTPKQRRAFEKLLDEHPDWRDELDEMAELVGATRKLHLRAPDPAAWDNYWEEIDSRLERGAGWTIALIGSVFLIAFGFAKVLAHAENGWVKAGILLMVLGLIVLFVSVLRGRILEVPKDRYRRIKR